MSFDWIFFDCFNTLIDDFTPDGDESGVKPILGLPVAAGFYATEAEFKVDYDRWKRGRWSGNDWGEVDLAVRLKEILTTKDASRKDEVPALVNRMMRRFKLEYTNTLRLTPGICEMLKRWRDIVKMGVISNFYLRDWPQRMLMKFGLYDYFDFVIDSASFGFKKPGQTIYLGALQRAAISVDQAERVLFIGDNLANDVLAPMELGMKVIYLDRSNDRPTSELVPEGVSSIKCWTEFKPENFQGY
ncbi:MAG: HAD family hydrolase [Candidatus Poribacteria bacterium]|nr:HAD family hydrolase [Candidatus Poribacteria bacterium]MDE0503251.1 HAD family hydrolase [Candidatus Poribacteria bacterium]